MMAQLKQIRLSHALLSSTVLPLREKFIISKATEDVYKRQALSYILVFHQILPENQSQPGSGAFSSFFLLRAL